MWSTAQRGAHSRPNEPGPRARCWRPSPGTVLTRTDPLPRLLEKVREAFGLSSVALLEQAAGDQWLCVASSGPLGCKSPEEADVDVAVEEDLHLVGSGRSLDAADRRLLEVVGGQALLALRSQRAAAQAEDSRRRAEATEIRSALLSAVGHDLRSPLTSIKVAAASLRDPNLRLPAADRLELTATSKNRRPTDHAGRQPARLLKARRPRGHALAHTLGYDEVAIRALAELDRTGRVTLDIDEALPDVLADPGLLERVVANVVDNALRYAGKRPSRCAPAPTTTASNCASSTPGRGCPSASGRACSPRSDAWVPSPATATDATGSGWDSPSREASPNSWAAR